MCRNYSRALKKIHHKRPHKQAVARNILLETKKHVSSSSSSFFFKRSARRIHFAWWSTRCQSGGPAAEHRTSCCGSVITLHPGWSWSVNKKKKSLQARPKGCRLCFGVHAFSDTTGWQQQCLPQGEEAIYWGGGGNGGEALSSPRQPGYLLEKAGRQVPTDKAP